MELKTADRLLVEHRGATAEGHEERIKTLDE